MYLKVSFGAQRLSVIQFGGCPIFGSRKCTASTGIAVGTSMVVHYSEEVRYWEGPLSEVPLYIVLDILDTLDAKAPVDIVTHVRCLITLFLLFD